MTVSFAIDLAELVRWQYKMTKRQQATPRMVSNALNHFGRRLKEQWTGTIAQNSGLPEETIAGLIDFKAASPNNLEVRLNATGALAVEPPNQRPLPTTVREWANRRVVFQPGTLVNIVTFGDIWITDPNASGGRRKQYVCEECERISEEGPYTIEEANVIMHNGAGIHPHCRCSIVPFTPKERFKVSFATQRGMTRPRSLGMYQIFNRLLAAERSAFQQALEAEWRFQGE